MSPVYLVTIKNKTRCHSILFTVIVFILHSIHRTVLWENISIPEHQEVLDDETQSESNFENVHMKMKAVNTFSSSVCSTEKPVRTTSCHIF